jgi:hypothetical protein
MTTSEAPDTPTAERPSGHLGGVDFVTLGGVAAVLAVVTLLGGIFTHIAYGGSPPDGMDVYLNDIHADHAGNMLAASLDASAFLLLLVFMVALYQLFRDDGGTMRLALLAGGFGLLLVTTSRFLSMTEVELAARYAAADGATQAAIAAMAETVVRMKALIGLVGNLLAWGVGGLLFSLAIIRTSVLSRWLGIGGLVYASVMWITAVEVAASQGLTSRDSIAYFLGAWFGIIWLLAMGIAPIRLDETTAGAVPSD